MGNSIQFHHVRLDTSLVWVGVDIPNERLDGYSHQNTTDTYHGRSYVEGEMDWESGGWAEIRGVGEE